MIFTDDAISPQLSAKRRDGKATAFNDDLTAWIDRVFEVISASFFAIKEQSVDKVFEYVNGQVELLQLFGKDGVRPTHMHRNFHEAGHEARQGGD